MTYHVVFDISERVLDAQIGQVFGLVFWVLLAMLLLPLTRRWIVAGWPVLLAVGALGFGLEIWRTEGGWTGLMFGVGAPAMAFAASVPAWKGEMIPFVGPLPRYNRPVSARKTVIGMAYVFIGLVWVIGNNYGTVPDLVRELNDGQATVLSGPVEDVFSGNAGNECFSVSGQRFCYSAGGSFSPGFHQTAANGGPIHNGLQVRVSAIDGQIVRLEVADGQ